MSSAYQGLLGISLGLISRRLRSARAAGVGLVAHFLFADFVSTNSIVATSFHFINELAERLTLVSPFKLPLFKSFIESLQIFLCAFRFPHFVELSQERLRAALAVWEAGNELRGSNRSPELHVRMLQKQADQCFGYPILRLRLLREIENVNQTKGLFVQAYITRLQICALVETVVKYLGTERLPTLDFTFHPIAIQERQFDVSYCKPDLQKLLTTDPSFCVKGLITELTAAIELATRGHLYWHARRCRLLLVEIFQTLRDSDQLANAMPGLADSYTQIENSDEPLRFFLVEHKRNGDLITRSIFASTHPSLKAFSDWLMQSDQRRFEDIKVAQQFKNFDELSGGPETGVGVTEVFATAALKSSYQTQEFSHVITYESVGWDEIGQKEILFITENPHPTTCVSLRVIELKEKTLTRWERLFQETQKVQEKLELTRKRCLIMLPHESIAETVRKRGAEVNLGPLVKELQTAIRSSVVKDFAEAIEIEGERGEKVKTLGDGFLKEIEMSLRAALWSFRGGQDSGGGEPDPSFMRAFTQVAAIKGEATAFAVNIMKRNLTLGQLEKRADPIEYKLPAGFEDFP